MGFITSAIAGLILVLSFAVAIILLMTGLIKKKRSLAILSIVIAGIFASGNSIASAINKKKINESKTNVKIIIQALANYKKAVEPNP